MFNKDQCKNVGKQLVEAGTAVSDGIDISDIGEAMDVMKAIMSASDEFQADKRAALLLVVAGAAETMADELIGHLKLPVETEPEAPPGIA